MRKAQLSEKVCLNEIGAHAIRHTDGWWVGNDKGILCYKDHYLARVALTILWQRDGGKKLNYSIQTFTGADTINGTHTPKFSAEEAINNYEDKPKRCRIRS
jgi:hypothetical protein